MTYKRYRRTETFEISDPITHKNIREIARWCGGQVITDLFDQPAIRIPGYGEIADIDDRIALQEQPPGFLARVTPRQFEKYETLLDREGDLIDIQSFSEDLKSQLRERRGNAQSDTD